jgi:1-acyl-sn-glycerol-3-phosphate acyltransferase
MTFLRSALFNLFFFVTTFLLSLCGAGIRLVAPHRAYGVVLTWGRLQVWAARVLCGIRFAVTGREHLPQGAALIASQHQSTFDTMIWLLLVPRCSYVLKRELARLPLFGGLVKPSGMIAVDRDAGGAAMRGLMRDGKRAAAEGRQIVIFPEGTRAAPGTVLPILPGVAALAASTGLPVIPVATDSGRLWGRRAFRKLPGVIRVAILPPLPPRMPRGALLARLDAIYRAGVSVDNSVGGPADPLADSASRKREPLDRN